MRLVTNVKEGILWTPIKSVSQLIVALHAQIVSSERSKVVHHVPHALLLTVYRVPMLLLSVMHAHKVSSWLLIRLLVNHVQRVAGNVMDRIDVKFVLSDSLEWSKKTQNMELMTLKLFRVRPVNPNV